MRIALFTDTFLPDVNGVAKTLGRWVKFLESKGAECKVFAPCGEAEAYSHTKMVERYYSIPFLLYPECRLAIPNPIHLNKTLKAFMPDLIHVATPFNLGLTGLHFAKRNSVPLVASYHTHFDQYLSFYKLQWMEPMLWKYLLWFHQDCQRIYVPSRSTLLHLQKKGLQHLEIWSRGVETSRFHPIVDKERIVQQYGIQPRKFVILFVGRLAPEKSVDVVMETYFALPEPIRSASQLVITGDGPLYRPLLEQYEHQPDVTFTGFKQGQELSELYAAADLFLFPSETETFGNVVLEAMASGTPVIGSDAGGVKDIIEHGHTGILCPPGDIPQFVHAVELLYHNSVYRSQLSAAGRVYSLQQSWDHIFAGLYESYLNVMNSSGTARSSDAIAAK
ncbi:glycosyltransferase family 1 protein [Paenibacillus sp. RC67]|uniref:glycosyltransferase family 4 protein n=1 Tax=Paenibacillus sp. RC67 TaxID=3039392 RepID=UPI0024AE7233|nr:glycosyltransferase family 1 protein [Paenibacillus sp. RC67]